MRPDFTARFAALAIGAYLILEAVLDSSGIKTLFVFVLVLQTDYFVERLSDGT